RHTRFSRDWSSDVCSSDLVGVAAVGHLEGVVGGSGDRVRRGTDSSRRGGRREAERAVEQVLLAELGRRTDAADLRLELGDLVVRDRKSTRLNSSHVKISYA